MAERRRAAAGVVAGLTALAALAACSDDDPTLLTDDDLPGVQSTTDFENGQPTATTCSELTVRIPSVGISPADGPEPVTTSYRLESGDIVTASVFVPGTRYRDADGALAAVQEAIEACVAKGEATAVDDLAGLPEGTIGFRSSPTGNDGDQGVQLLAPTDDGRIVSVTVVHDGSGDPSVDPAGVLEAALDNASDVS
ncbi:hypothetical protein [Nocardioides pyridinolyticus]